MLNIPAARPVNSTRAGFERNQFPGFGVVVLHQSFEQVRDKFAPGAILLSWWSWQVTALVWRWSFKIVRTRQALPASLLHHN